MWLRERLLIIDFSSALESCETHEFTEKVLIFLPGRFAALDIRVGANPSERNLGRAGVEVELWGSVFI